MKNKNPETKSLNDTNDLETKQNTESTQMPALPAQAMLSETAGLEELNREDFQIPRIKLLQSTSSEVQDGAGVAGEWLNTLSYEPYGNSLIFTPITLWKSRCMFDDGEAVCRSPNAQESINGKLCYECPHSKWRKDRTPPACALAYNYLILPEDDAMAAIVQLSKTSFSAGRALNTLLVAARKLPFFYKYELRAVKRSNSYGTFYVATSKKYIIDGEPVETANEERELAKHFYGLWVNQNQVNNFDDEVPF